METGTIKALRLDKGFGFISRPQGQPDLFFHCCALSRQLEFNEQLLERTVRYDVEHSQQGLRACRIVPLD